MQRGQRSDGLPRPTRTAAGVRTGLSCGSQFLVGNIAPRIELCGGVEAMRQIAASDGCRDGQTGKQ